MKSFIFNIFQNFNLIKDLVNNRRNSKILKLKRNLSLKYWKMWSVELKTSEVIIGSIKSGRLTSRL